MKVNSVQKVTSSFGGCGCTILLFNLLLGGWSVDYCLNAILGKNIPWYGDVIIGLFTAEVSVPLAIVLWILSLFGIHFPIIK